MEIDARKALYAELESILATYGDRFKVYKHEGKYSLYTKKEVVVFHKNPEEMYFAGLRENKNMVSFYFMPLYCNPPLIEKVPASLKKFLKGHTCFNLKALTPEMKEDLKKLLDSGIVWYREQEWV